MWDLRIEILSSTQTQTDLYTVGIACCCSGKNANGEKINVQVVHVFIWFVWTVRPVQCASGAQVQAYLAKKKRKRSTENGVFSSGHGLTRLAVDSLVRPELFFTTLVQKLNCPKSFGTRRAMFMPEIRTRTAFLAASVAQWLVLSLSKRKVAGSNGFKSTYGCSNTVQKPSLAAPGYLANAR